MCDEQKQPSINTARLLLRPFSLADAQDVQSLAGQAEVSETTLNIPYPYEDGMAEAWISTHPDMWASRTGVSFAVSIRESGELIGAMSLTKIDGVFAELGYWIGVPFWGKGYCTEAAGALMEFASSTVGITHFRAVHLVSNPASGRVLEKLELQLIGHRQIRDRNGAMADIAVYECTNS